MIHVAINRLINFLLCINRLWITVMKGVYLSGSFFFSLKVQKLQDIIFLKDFVILSPNKLNDFKRKCHLHLHTAQNELNPIFFAFHTDTSLEIRHALQS